MSNTKINPDSILNVLGKTQYIDDIPEKKGMLHAAIIQAPSAHGKFSGLSISDISPELFTGSYLITAKDVPGKNQLTLAADEGAICEKEWTYKGQVLGLILSENREKALKLAAKVKILDREDLLVITDPREAFKKGLVLAPPRVQNLGDVDKAFTECDFVIEGQADSAGQEHVYLETQGAIAEPLDDGGVFVISGTQNPTGVQETVATVLGLPMNKVSVETRRLGGAFGGKEEQGSNWACLAAIAAIKTGKTVKIYLTRREDMISSGKRHPYSSDYKIGLKKDGTILALDVTFYQNSGAACDLSPAILPRTLFHANGAYKIPNVRASASMCRTNLVPFTAFRGFGGPQGFFVIESAIENAANKMGMSAIDIQKKNLLEEGFVSHYGMKMNDVRAIETFNLCQEKASYDKLISEIDNFNKSHKDTKRGIAMLPLCFGISFTKIMLNQGGALVHVYNDGSVSVNTGAVEMGQGVARKIAIVAAEALGAPLEQVRVESTRTITVANTVATAASTGADINAMAAQIAAKEIRKRLDSFNEPTKSFTELAKMAFENRIDLSAHAYYATPGLDYDMKTESGNPFLYHVYGAALVTSEIDIITGTYKFCDAFIVHDIANSIDKIIDRGQVEGAFVQGLGWSCLEELKFDQAGNLLANTLSTYKVPDIDFVPELHVSFFNKPNPKAVVNSKAVGEPPLMYGIAGYFAVLNALRSVKPNKEWKYDLPLTPEKVLTYLMD